MNLKFLQRPTKKTKSTATRELKALSILSFWCSSHRNCFKGTIGKGESEEHLDAKYGRWKYWRKHGHDVYVELRLKNGLRPDLTIVMSNGEIIHEEIIVSEKIESIIRKINKYPFTVRRYKVEIDDRNPHNRPLNIKTGKVQN